MNVQSLIVCLSILASPAFAKDKKPRKSQLAMGQVKDSEEESEAKTHSGKRIVKGPSGDVVITGSSEANRQTRTFSATVMPIGISVVPVQGATLGYYLTPDQILEVNHESGKVNFIFFDMSESLTSVRLKSFWGNSFYTNLGLGFQKYGYSFKISEFDGAGNQVGDYRHKAENSAFGGEVSIGNRWQWQEFTIGCDWIGVFKPFSLGGKTKVDVDGRSVDPAEVARAEKEMEKSRKQGAGHALRFYLGVSF